MQEIGDHSSHAKTDCLGQRTASGPAKMGRISSLTNTDTRQIALQSPAGQWLWILRQTRRLRPPCLRAFHSPSPSTLIPVLSAARQGIAQQCPRGDQQVQRAFRAAIRDVDRKRTLPSADGAEVRHGPVQPRQPQETFHKPSRLAKRHPEKHLHGQANLDRGITEGPQPAPLAGGFGIPVHLRIEPDRQ